MYKRQDYVEQLNALFEIVDDDDETEDDDSKFPIYTKTNFLYGKEDGRDRVYMSEEDYDTLVGLVRNKKNVILQGAPEMCIRDRCDCFCIRCLPGRRLHNSDV